MRHRPDSLPGPATVELVARALAGSGEPLPAGRVAWDANRAYIPPHP